MTVNISLIFKDTHGERCPRVIWLKKDGPSVVFPADRFGNDARKLVSAP